MKMLSAGYWVLGAALLASGCKTDDPATPWEIIRGTASLVASKSLHPTTGAVLGDFPTRTGSLTVAADSTVTGWIRLAAGDTVFFTAGVVANDAGLVMTLPGLVPAEYTVITDGDFPDTYGLLSTASVTDGDVAALHKVYWEFAR
jgi:hypothetical protein